MKAFSTPSSRLIALATVTFFAACGDGTTAPPPDPPRATTITVSPATAELAALGETVQLSAEVRDQNGQAMAGAAVTWASSAAAVASVGASGLVTAVANGSATITATSGSASGSATVTVAQQVNAVAVTPDTATVVAGDTLRLAATATDANGQVVTGIEIAWASGDTAVAVVDASGLVQGTAEGTATITATAGDASGTSEITVFSADRPVLIGLYEATDGPNWRDNTNWLTDAPLGEWYGVDTDASGRVVRLDLSGTPIDGGRTPGGLAGAIPAELGGLTNLETLDLGHNDLTGPIPSELGGLANLETLVLGDNALTGSIPVELSGLANLGTLWLADNRLTGTIPPELGNLASLWQMSLGGNELSGAVPAELGGLANLNTLYLGWNQLSGTIPSAFR